MQSRGWCWTLNNYTDEDISGLQDIINEKTGCIYCIYGIETAPSTGTPHLQGYFYFKRKCTLSRCRKILERAHFIKANGTPQDNKVYCSKDDNATEYGECPLAAGLQGAQAEQERWKTARELAIEGRMEDIIPELYIKFYSTFKRIHKDHMVMPTDLDGSLEHTWWYGSPGTGKSRQAHIEYPQAYRKALNKWWDGYNGEETVIIDEIEKESKMFGHLFKIWGDRYSFIAETKGHAVAIRPKKIILISNYSIQEVFGEDSELQKAIERRYHQVHFNDYFKM